MFKNLFSNTSKSAEPKEIEAQINSILANIKEPVSGKRILETGLLSDISYRSNQLRIIIEHPIGYTGDLNSLRTELETKLSKISGIEKVSFLITSHKAEPHSARSQAIPERAKPNTTSIRPPNIGKMIAVYSAKGGVGKSTIAYNLAQALSRAGFSVGILDADIYGPSLPTLMGKAGEKCDSDENGKISPAHNHGIKAMSIGFMVEKGQSLAWRGPMVSKALIQLFQGVNWGSLDYMIIDMPPGTGDVQLSLAQQARIDGAIMVSTPQEIALSDVERGVSMFNKAGVKIIGLVENMSLLKDENNGSEIDLFGRGGAVKMANQLGIDSLGEIYFHPSLRISADEGAATPFAAIAQFDDLAQLVLQKS